VCGAGSTAVNGVYKFDRYLSTQDGSPLWIHLAAATTPTVTTTITSEQQQVDTTTAAPAAVAANTAAAAAAVEKRLVLFRCNMKLKERNWYISMPHDPAAPGSEKVKLQLQQLDHLSLQQLEHLLHKFQHLVLGVANADYCSSSVLLLQLVCLVLL
jgi:hypothetical protein